jgi:DNA topoisomerase II
MPISSLTSERVAKLLQQKSDKQDELNALLKLSAKDIWNHDLDDLAMAWQDVLEDDRRARSVDATQKKKGASSKFTKVNRKRVSDAADGEYQERKPKVAKTKANASPRTTQSKITSFTSKPTEPKGTKGMHTASFTSVNKAGSSSSVLTKKEDVFKTPISFDDDEDFDILVRGIRPAQKPVTIDLLSPETAVKPKKTFAIPGVKKPSFAAPAPKPRAVSKSKPVKRKIESDDEEEFSFMADDKPASTETGGRRPARAAASKKTIVLTSDISDEEDDFEEDEDDE